MAVEFTSEYDLFNFYQNKHIAIVVTIDGVPDLLSSRPLYTKIRYGDPNILYNSPNIVYGGLIRLDGVRDILSLEGSSLTLTQRLEPEQGKGGISTLTLAFIDKDGFMSNVIAPGQVVPEILGRNVLIELGYEEISYPQDYFVILRGIITQVQSRSGLVTLQVSDANTKRRQKLFFSAKTKTTSAINSSVTTIPVASNSDFPQQILGPDATFDDAIKNFIKIDDEFIQYGTASITGTSFTGVTRGTRGTTAVAHDSGSDVSAFLEITDHAIDMALKLMLSGWVGNWIFDETVLSFENTLDPSIGNIHNAVVLPLHVDADRKYGIVPGDFITITGATNAQNNGTFTVVELRDIGEIQPNQIIIINGNTISEFPTSAKFALRSQYDTYPTTAGLRLTPAEVDVAGHLELKTTFLASSENFLQFLVSAQESGKGFIESEIYLPVSAYSVTRRGRMSAKITKPPLATSPLQFFTKDNIIDPQNIAPMRGTNTRKFFNEVVFEYDADDSGTFLSTFRLLDTDSLNLIGFSSVLPIKSRGIHTAVTPTVTDALNRRARFLVSRYKRGATEISLKTMWGIGSKVEGGDVVALDGADLSISNFENGTRDFGVQLFEVIDRGLDIKSGQVTFKLISGVGFTATDRFATISPSSLITSGATTTTLPIIESFTIPAPRFPHNEGKKWKDYVGKKIVIHNESYSVYEETTFLGFDGTNVHILRVNALSFTPTSGYIVDIPRYPTDTNILTNSTYKAVHAFLSPTVTVVSGISTTKFTVSAGEAPKFLTSAVIRVHSPDFTSDSGDVFILDRVGVTIETRTSMGFTPSAGYLVDLIGFLDRGGAYRWI